MKSLNSTIDRAPEIPGARKLQPDEPARLGDRYLYLRTTRGVAASDLVLSNLAEVLADAGFISVGRSLNDSRDAWAAEGSDADEFDGILYRPLP